MTGSDRNVQCLTMDNIDQALLMQTDAMIVDSFQFRLNLRLRFEELNKLRRQITVGLHELQEMSTEVNVQNAEARAGRR